MDSDQGPGTEANGNTDTEVAPVSTSSRRDLVTKGAVAAAVAAVASGALTNRVHAANGDTMLVGAANTADIDTSISGGSTFKVTNGDSSEKSSIYGSATGTDPGLYGVRGNNAGGSGAGVYGEHTGTSIGTGVHGKSEAGYGVRGSGARADFLAVGSGKLHISKAATPDPTPTANGLVGTIARDAAGALWYCYATNKWRELAGATSSGAFHPIPPRRVYDSRSGQAPLSVTKGKLSPGSTRVVDCTVEAPEVPSSATAVVLNLTAANTTGLGFLAVYPDGAAAPTTSSINFTPGVNIANSTTSGCGPAAKVKVLAGGNSGADFIIDIVGYYV